MTDFFFNSRDGVRRKGWTARVKFLRSLCINKKLREIKNSFPWLSLVSFDHGCCHSTVCTHQVTEVFLN